MALSKAENYTFHDEVADLDGIAIILRSEGFYWEAEKCEQVADTMHDLINRLRSEVANDVG